MPTFHPRPATTPARVKAPKEPWEMTSLRNDEPIVTRGTYNLHFYRLQPIFWGSKPSLFTVLGLKGGLFYPNIWVNQQNLRQRHIFGTAFLLDMLGPEIFKWYRLPILIWCYHPNLLPKPFKEMTYKMENTWVFDPRFPINSLDSF